MSNQLPDEAKLAVTALTTSLKPEGVMFISVKHGEGNNWEKGRYFEYYNEESIHALFDHDPRLTLIKLWHSTAPGLNGGGEIKWLNVLLRRRSHRPQNRIALLSERKGQNGAKSNIKRLIRSLFGKAKRL